MKRDVQLAPQFITIRNLVFDVFYLAAIVTNVWRYITFACPDHLGGDGVVFACTAHAKTCFRILIYPAVFVYLGNQKLSFLHLLFEED